MGDSASLTDDNREKIQDVRQALYHPPGNPCCGFREQVFKRNDMNEELTVIDDLELAEMAEQEMEIMINSIPDSRSFEVINEVIRRFREKLTH